MILISDIETDGFDPSIIWCVGVMDYKTKEYMSFHGDDVVLGLMLLAEAEMVVGHNFRCFDARHIRKMTDGIVDLKSIYDTYDASRRFFPKMPNHKLESWGELFGYPKIAFNDFHKFSNEMLEYLERDVRLNERVFDVMLQAEWGNPTISLPWDTNHSEGHSQRATLLESYR